MSCTSPYGWQATRLRAIGRATSEIEIEDLAKRIVARLRSIRSHTQAGAYLLADAERYVYILPEASRTTEYWVRIRPAMIVGRYISVRRSYPDPERIIEDLIAHFLTEVA